LGSNWRGTSGEKSRGEGQEKKTPNFKEKSRITGSPWRRRISRLRREARRSLGKLQLGPTPRKIEEVGKLTGGAGKKTSLQKPQRRKERDIQGK